MAVATRFAGDLQTAASLALRLCDLMTVAVAAVVTYAIWHGNLDLPGLYQIAIIAAVLLTANFFQVARLYPNENLGRFVYQISRVLVGWTAVIFTLVTLAFVTKTSETFSRGWALLWIPVTLGGFVSLRVVLAILLSRWRERGALAQYVAVVGAGEYGQRLVREMLARNDPSLRIVGIFDRRRTRIPDEIEGIPVRGTIEDLHAFVRRNRVDEIVVALPWRSGGNLIELVQMLKSMPVNVKWCPETIAFQMPVRSLSNLAGVTMISVYDRPISGRNRIVKAFEDRIGSLVLLLILSPLLLLIAMLIRLDSPGPAVFRQRRFGFNNEEFTVFKFRTMRAGAPGAAKDGDAMVQATRDDVRVTRIGRFLRRTSLDELPQLVNVLRGEMSLVGPRPHAVAHNEEYGRIIDEYFARHRVKPGITGWAQVHGLRGETDTPEKMRQRVEYDLYYIDNWSILLDIRILFLTLFVGFVNRNAY